MININILPVERYNIIIFSCYFACNIKKWEAIFTAYRKKNIFFYMGYNKFFKASDFDYLINSNSKLTVQKTTSVKLSFVPSTNSAPVSGEAYMVLYLYRMGIYFLPMVVDN